MVNYVIYIVSDYNGQLMLFTLLDNGVDSELELFSFLIYG